MKKKLLSILCAVCLLLGATAALPSCVLIEPVGILDADINEYGELIIKYSNGREQNLGIVTGGDGKDSEGSGGDVSIVVDGGSSTSAASSKGLRSAVSIVCGFKTDTVQSSPLLPGFGTVTEKEYSSAGSGVIYKMDRSRGDAFIITNYHVVYDSRSKTENGISDDIKVYLYGSEIGDKAIAATYVGGSVYYDIAVLRIDGSGILKASDARAADVANSDEILVGDTAIAIGNAQGYGVSASLGIVSVDSEYITMKAADDSTTVSFRVMRIDTAVNSGNSGGGLYDDEGRLMGIVNAKIVDDGVENIGYAIPSNVAVSIAENIIDYCYGTEEERVQRALMGITVTTSDSKAVFDEETGAYKIVETVIVKEVNAGSLAEGVIMPEDVLVGITIGDRSVAITRQYHVIDPMLDVRVGDVVKLDLLRDGKPTTVSITITADCLTEY